MNFFMEVAKLRAARLLWAKLMKPFNPKTRARCRCAPLPDLGLVADRAGRLQQRRAHHHRGDGGDQGHTQSLHTNALDEALALPTDFSARIARNTQLFLQQESGTTRIIDPWGGSYYVERLTHDLAAKAWGHIEEVEALGGMAKAIEPACPSCASRKPPPRPRRGSTPAAGGDRRQQIQAGRTRRRSTCSRSTTPRCARQIDKLKRLRAERDRMRWRRCSAATAPRSRPSPASTSGRRPHDRTAVEKVQALIDAFEEPKAAGRASWSPRSARTATTAARR
jgi:methylmalonyl-CoA mutase